LKIQITTLIIFTLILTSCGKNNVDSAAAGASSSPSTDNPTDPEAPTSAPIESEEETEDITEDSDIDPVQLITTQSIEVDCDSFRYQYKKCDLSSMISGEILSVEVVDKRSNSSCDQDVSFGIVDSDSIYVDKGCRAIFKVTFGTNIVTKEFELDKKKKSTYIDCDSWNYQYAECGVLTDPNYEITKISVKKKRSHSSCTKNSSYGILEDKLSIYVDHGCRAEFKVEYYAKDLGFSEIAPKAFNFGELGITPKTPLLTQIDISTNTGELTYKNDGLGVESHDNIPVNDQINHHPDTLETEAIAFELPGNTLDIEVQISRLFKSEGSGERAYYYALNSQGLLIEKGVIDRSSLDYGHSNDKGLLKLSGLNAKYLIFTALPYEDPESRKNDSSDYHVKSIKVKYVSVLP
jgi:hypothetical protein